MADESHVEGIDSTESLIIDLPTIRIATDNFAEDHKLGEGGFGAVYKVLELLWYCAYSYILSCFLLHLG